MKKIILAFVLGLCLTPLALAQNNPDQLRVITVGLLVNYGQKLYDRGNFPEAKAVFNRVLTYDAKQSQALHYLKLMGQAQNVSQIFTYSKMTIDSIPYSTVSSIDVYDTQSLKKAIDEKHRIIADLKKEVSDLRSQSVVNPTPQNLEMAK